MGVGYDDRQDYGNGMEPHPPQNDFGASAVAPAQRKKPSSSSTRTGAPVAGETFEFDENGRRVSSKVYVPPPVISATAYDRNGRKIKNSENQGGRDASASLDYVDE